MIEVNPMLRADIFTEHEVGVSPTPSVDAAPAAEEGTGPMGWFVKTSAAVSALTAWIERLP